ncbi:MAG: ParB N-terminal domain-containing protein [Phycisphaeraceae bacterium]|nr:MAG: ParB N-terminal domain-containing protein [Phycisphaeraceae bacterium]
MCGGPPRRPTRWRLAPRVRTEIAVNIETLSIDAVKEYDRNPRTISDAAIDAVAKSIEAFGFKIPILIDADGVIIAGHTRLRAARKLGLKEVPTIRASDLTPDQVKALRIADNKLHELSAWDMELLPIELADLKGVDFDLAVLGFSADDLAAIMAPAGNDGLTDPDDVPAPPDAATTVPGDIWVLGNHRLMCGDSSKPEDLDRLLDGQPIHLVNTDPPYNVKVEPRSNNAIAAGITSFSRREDLQCERSQSERGKKDRERLARKNTHHQSMDLARHPEKAQPTTRKMRAKDRPLANDFVSDDEFDRLLAAWFGNIARVLIPGGGFYIWGGYANCANYPPVLKAMELYFSQAIIWIKEHPVLTRKDFMGNHEWCFYGWREGAAHRFFGPNNVPDTWSIKKVNPNAMVHLTEKPVELARRAMEYSSRPGENVLDLFGGSGSTLIAAEMTGRRAYLMELDPLYCDVIVQRWEKFAGRKAERLTAEARS